ncbi:MAG: hypothetical protein HDT32_03735 [Clostridiales bacterium]|nr:hypothetical protein [Clostridiales bacterium]
MKENMEEVRRAFFKQVQSEYDSFRHFQLRSGVDKVYKNSLKVTFYKEVYKYLMDDVLRDEEYNEFLGEKIIEKLWDIFVVSELPRQSRDYLRQLINLYRENNARQRKVA